MRLTVSIIQMDIADRNPEHNRSHMRQMIERACSTREKCDVVVLPETCTTGYSERVFAEIARFAESESGETIESLRRIAQANALNIVTGSLPERSADRIYNTVYFIDREGNLIGKYRKIHRYSAMKEDTAFAPGQEMPVFSTDHGKVALMSCYDIRFAELSRTYALRGAKLIYVVANFPNPKVQHWRTLLQARAIENQLYVVACNRVGTAEQHSYFGHSLIIDPWGEILAEGDDTESLVTATLDFARIDEVRQKIPMYRDRQPASYSEDLLRPAQFDF